MRSVVTPDKFIIGACAAGNASARRRAGGLCHGLAGMMTVWAPRASAIFQE